MIDYLLALLAVRACRDYVPEKTDNYQVEECLKTGAGIDFHLPPDRKKPELRLVKNG